MCSSQRRPTIAANARGVSSCSCCCCRAPACACRESLPPLRSCCSAAPPVPRAQRCGLPCQTCCHPAARSCLCCALWATGSPQAHAPCFSSVTHMGHTTSPARFQRHKPEPVGSAITHTPAPAVRPTRRSPRPPASPPSQLAARSRSSDQRLAAVCVRSAAAHLRTAPREPARPGHLPSLSSGAAPQRHHGRQQPGGDAVVRSAPGAVSQHDALHRRAELQVSGRCSSARPPALLGGAA